MRTLIQYFTLDPTNLTLKGKALAILSGGIAMYFVAFITRECGMQLSLAYPVIVSSIGASAALLFIIPHSPLAQPWSVIGGQTVSAFVGMSCAIYIPDVAWASACAVSGSFLAMLLLRCLHPPGASTALAPIMGGAPLIAVGYDFVLMPVGINVVVILIMTLILSRFLQRVPYPVLATTPKNKQEALIHQDIKQALTAMNAFIDVTEGDLVQLLTYAESYRLQRLKTELFCAELMNTKISSMPNNASIKKAWQLMYQKQLKALVVVNNKKQVVGMITWADFFKLMHFNVYAGFFTRTRYVVHQLLRQKSNYPEKVEDIMSASVAVLFVDSPFEELMELMAKQGYRQVPIVNHQRQLVGMISQTDLINALYRLQAVTAT